MLNPPTVEDMATFSGRAVATYGSFSTAALAQATLLFRIITRRTEYPDDPDQLQLARNAIMEMAERIYLEQPFAAQMASPFHSETIGSYSYAKGSTVYRARLGENTGLFWWDLAIDELSLVVQSEVVFGSIHVIEPSMFAEVITGDRYILGPADLNTTVGAGEDINTDLGPRLRLG